MVLPSAARVGLARMDTASANGTGIDVDMVMAFPSGVGDGAASDLGQHDRGHLQAMNQVSVDHRCFNRMSCAVPAKTTDVPVRLDSCIFAEILHSTPHFPDAVVCS